MGRKRKSNQINKDAWLNTYADMITLILVFFILLYSMSTIDQEKYQMLVEAFTADPATLEQIRQMNQDNDKQGGTSDNDKQNEQQQDPQSESEKINDLNKLYEHLKNYVNENNLQNSVQIEKGKNIVYVRFMSSLFFEADRAVLRSGGTEILDYVGKALEEIEPYIKFIRIDGHTAEAAPGTSTVDNRGLSTDRANEVLRYLENRYIHEPSKLMAVGYGYYRPIAPNDSEENRAKNRRVEILIAQQDTLQDELDKIYGLDYGTSSVQDNE